MKTSTAKKFTVLSGTNREGAYSLKVAENVKAFFEATNHSVQLLDLANLPLEIFHPQSYTLKPHSFSHWQETIFDSRGLVFVIPEYNGGIPGVLKYFIDMLKFPESFKEIPIALIGISAGLSGANAALQEFTAILKYLKADVFEQKIYLPKCYDSIDKNGAIQDEVFQVKLHQLLTNFGLYCHNFHLELSTF